MRPRRIYKDGNRFFYIIKGKRRYIKIKEDITEKQVVRANQKRVEKQDEAKRVKPRAERKPILPYRFEQPIVNGDIGRLITTQYYNPPIRTASSGFVEQGKKISSIEDIITGAERKKREKFGENIVDFFTSLASKKNELFANFTITQSPSTLTRPTAADTTKDDIDVSSKDVEASDDEYKREIINTFMSFENFASLWKNDDPAYRAMLNRIITKKHENDSTPLREDRRKNLIKKFENDDQLRDIFDYQKKKVLETGGLPIQVNKSDLTGITPISSLNDEKEEGILQESKGEEPTLSGDTRPSSPLPPIDAKPRYQKPGGKKPFLKTGEGTLASSGVKPLTTEEKLASTPSYSGTPQGTEAPAEPLRSVPTSSPMAVSIAEQVRREMGFGEYNSDNGLFNDEIAKIIRKRVGKVIPVVPSDKVNDLLSYVVKGDKKFAAVINTNPSQSDGSGNDGHRPGHWRGIFIDCQDDFPSCEYFDPLAEGKPEKALVDVMKRICKKMNPEKMCLFKQNNIRRQAKEKSTCGWHVLQFIDDRWRGIPWAEASGYNNYMEKLKEPIDDSMDGEKEVEKYIKKYEVYI
jgi:hypothetical protein